MPIKNGRDFASGSVVSKQVCVIGTGPAGVTVAWELQKAGRSVVLIEGSRFYEQYPDSWPDKVLLYNGEAEGLFKSNEGDFLILPFVDHQDIAWERERTYGGTGSHWGGQSRPFDPIDFEERPGFPGWPIKKDDLDPYYGKASRLCNLNGDYNEHGDNFTTEYWAQQLKTPALPVVEGFDVEMYQYLGSKFRNFATREFEPGVTIGDTDVLVIQNASLLDINHQGGRVSSLKVASMDEGLTPHPDTEFTIKADAFVLACGAVANARQLLLSKAGNASVGQNFSCHPLSRQQVVRLTQGFLNYDQARLLAGKYVNGTPWTDKNGVRVSGRFIPNAAETVKLKTGRCWFWYDYGAYYFEMTPNDGSYITLSDSVDPVFQQRQTKIFWDIRKADEDTYNGTINSYRTSIGKLGGKITNQRWDLVRPQLIVNGHHIGTTRMAADPAKGAVDKNLTLFGIDNLFVAGSSVFPTPGISNPTFTIIALSIRLAEHLTGKL